MERLRRMYFMLRRMVMENGTSIVGLPGEFGQSTLVIDDDERGTIRHFNTL